jgi:hypothetical protein
MKVILEEFGRIVQPQIDRETRNMVIYLLLEEHSVIGESAGSGAIFWEEGLCPRPMGRCA